MPQIAPRWNATVNITGDAFANSSYTYLTSIYLQDATINASKLIGNSSLFVAKDAAVSITSTQLMRETEDWMITNGVCRSSQGTGNRPPAQPKFS